MNKVYLVVFGAKIDREVVKGLFNSNPKTYWFYSLPSSMFIRTDLLAKDIQSIISAKYSGERCFVTEINTKNMGGFLPKEHVDLLFNRKTPQKLE